MFDTGTRFEAQRRLDRAQVEKQQKINPRRCLTTAQVSPSVRPFFGDKESPGLSESAKEYLGKTANYEEAMGVTKTPKSEKVLLSEEERNLQFQANNNRMMQNTFNKTFLIPTATCFNGHPLSKSETSRPFSCTLCHIDFKGNPFSCRFCHFLMCEDCLNKYGLVSGATGASDTGVDPSIIQTQHGQSLQPNVSSGGDDGGDGDGSDDGGDADDCQKWKGSGWNMPGRRSEGNDGSRGGGGRGG